MKRTFPYLNRLWRWAALAVWLPSVASVAAEDIPVSTGVFSVVCTTTHLGSIIDAVAREDIDAHTIIPFGMCPGHFDLTPGEAQALREADLLLYHGFERFLKGMELGSRAVAVGKQVGGNWMIPSIHMQAVYCVADILSAQRPELAGRMDERAARYVEAVDEAVDVVQARMAPYAGVPVICADMNRDLVEWFGLRVIATFPRDEEVSVRMMHEMLLEAKTAGVALVIDNRQSSGKVGWTLAHDLRAPCVELSNFPVDSPQAPDEYAYIMTLLDNSERLAVALETGEAAPRGH